MPWSHGEAGGNPGEQLKGGKAPVCGVGESTPQAWGFPAGVSGRSLTMGSHRVFGQMREDGRGSSGREPGWGLGKVIEAESVG